MPDWYLEDVTEVAAEHPDSFSIPPETERTSLQVGQLVRLHFVLAGPAEDQPRAERMWVCVTRRDETAAGLEYAGELTNAPIAIRDLQEGDEVRFRAQHVAQVFIPRGHPDWIPGSELAFVSAMIVDGGEPTRWAILEEPDRPENSGWQLLSGLETQEYTDDADNIRLVELNWLIDRDPALRALFQQQTPGGYERQGDDTWVLAQDWEPAPDDEA